MSDVATLRAAGHPVLPRQKRAIRQRDSLLDATEQVVAEEGAQAATTTRIARRAGVSVGTVYRYFEDRDALVLCAYDRTVDRIIDICSQTLAELESDVSADEAARTLLRTYLAAATSTPSHAPLLRAMRGIRSIEADFGSAENRINNDLLVPFLARFTRHDTAGDRVAIHLLTVLLGTLVDLCLLAENGHEAERIREETEAHMLLALSRFGAG